MQNIQYKESPSPHVIIENFLPIPAARACLTEAQWLEPVFEQAHTVGSPHVSEGDECEECRLEIQNMKLAIRSNDVVYLDTYYKGKRDTSVILAQLEYAFKSTELHKVFQKLPHTFPILNQTTHMETILSAYGMCDFYGWHTDSSRTSPRRFITCVLHFNTEPQKYEGGELILAGDTIEDQLPYKPVHNTAIFFESSKCVHAVGETRHEGAFKDSRFSINLWLGFNADEGDNQYKYR